MKYMKLDQKGNAMAEYIWIDANGHVRSKSKVRNFPDLLISVESPAFLLHDALVSRHTSARELVRFGSVIRELAGTCEPLRTLNFSDQPPSTFNSWVCCQFKGVL